MADTPMHLGARVYVTHPRLFGWCGEVVGHPYPERVRVRHTLRTGETVVTTWRRHQVRCLEEVGQGLGQQTRSAPHE